MLRHEALLDGTSDLKVVVYAIKFPLQLSFSQGRCDVAPYLPGNDAGGEFRQSELRPHRVK